MKKTKIIIAVAMLVSVGAPVWRAEAAATTTVLRTCDEVVSTYASVFRLATERAESLKNVRRSRIENLLRRWTDDDALKAAARATALRTKDQSLAELEDSLAGASDATKLALEAFKKSLKDAADARQSAVDAAAENFRYEVRSMLETRSSNLNAAVDEFAASLRMLLEATEGDCSSGVLPAVARARMENGLRAARERFQNDPRVKAAGPIDISGAVSEYREAVAAAGDEFRAKVSAAQAAFKAAIK